MTKKNANNNSSHNSRGKQGMLYHLIVKHLHLGSLWAFFSIRYKANSKLLPADVKLNSYFFFWLPFILHSTHPCWAMTQASFWGSKTRTRSSNQTYRCHKQSQTLDLSDCGKEQDSKTWKLCDQLGLMFLNIGPANPDPVHVAETWVFQS